MTAKTLAHYQVLEKIGAEAWARCTALKGMLCLAELFTSHQ